MDAEQRAAMKAKLRLRVPGLKESVGAGDLVHKVTAAMGMEHCSECERRKEALNRLLQFGKRERVNAE